MTRLIWMLTLMAVAVAVAVAAEDEDAAHYPESPAPAKDLGTELLQDETAFEESPYFSREGEGGRPPFLAGREEPPASFRAVEELNKGPGRNEPLFDTRRPSPTSPSSFGPSNRFRVSTQHLGSSGARRHGFGDNEEDFPQPSFNDGPLDPNQQWRSQFNSRLASRSSQTSSRGSTKFRGNQRYSGPRTSSQRNLEDPTSQLGAKYEYSYDINSDVTGDDKYHKEERDGNKVIGEYRVREADGSLRVVKYTADGESGFRATVNYEPGLGSNEKTNTEGPRLQPTKKGRERVKVFREDAPRQRNYDEALSRRGQEDRFNSQSRSTAAGSFQTGRQQQGPEFDRSPSRPHPQYKEDGRQSGSPQFHRGPPRDISVSPRDEPHLKGLQREVPQSSPFNTRNSNRDTGTESQRPLTQLKGVSSSGRDESRQQEFMDNKQDFRSHSQSQSNVKSGFQAQHGPDHTQGPRGSVDPKSGYLSQHGPDHAHSSRGSGDPQSGFRAQHGPDNLHGSTGSPDPKSGFKAQQGPDHFHGSRGSTDPKSGFRSQHGPGHSQDSTGSADPGSGFSTQHEPDHFHGSRGSTDPKSGFRAQRGPDHLHGSTGSADQESGFRAQQGPGHLHGSRGSAESNNEFRAQHGLDHVHGSKGAADSNSAFRVQHGADHAHGSRGSTDPKSGFLAQNGPDLLPGSRNPVAPLRAIQSHEEGITRGSQGFRSKTLQPMDEESHLRSSGGSQNPRIPSSQSAIQENPSYQQGRSQDFRNQNIRTASEESVSRFRGGSQTFGNENVQSQDAPNAFHHDKSQGFRPQTSRPRTDPSFSFQAGAQNFRQRSPQPVSDHSSYLQEDSAGSRGLGNPTSPQGSAAQQNIQGVRPRYQEQHRFDTPLHNQQKPQTSSEGNREFQPSSLREDLPGGGSAAWARPGDLSGRTGGRPSGSPRQGGEGNIDETLIRTEERFSSQQFRGNENSQNLNQGHLNREEHHIDAARTQNSQRGSQYEDSGDLLPRSQFPSRGTDSVQSPGRFPSSNLPSSDSQFSQNFQGSQSFRVGPPHPSFVGDDRPPSTSVVLEGSQHRFQQEPDQRGDHHQHHQTTAVEPSDAPRATFRGAGGREEPSHGGASNFPVPLQRDYRESNTEEEFLDQ
ncbi:uncharacterized protein LOC143040890 [Oratosquilla oratoria]|uniref:uncharacterized protein LOC143040890 n=1 Tax=Oratosquilla oratoria TaxID=337810 RepID=UPI003F75D8E6